MSLSQSNPLLLTWIQLLNHPGLPLLDPVIANLVPMIEVVLASCDDLSFFRCHVWTVCQKFGSCNKKHTVSLVKSSTY